MQLNDLNSLKSPWILFGAWWLFWTAIGTWLVHQFGFSWTTSFIDAAVTQLDWTLPGYVANIFLQYYRPNSKNIVNLIIFNLGLAAVFSYLILPWCLPIVVGDQPGYDEFLRNSLSIRFLLAWMQILFVAAMSWIWYFVKEQQQNEKRKSDAERMARDAELSQLRQQLQPHFLFNSLNSINALVTTQPDLARRMVQQLSDFLRGTVKKDDRQLVTLDEELEHLGLYLEIEKVRFGYRLNSSLDVDPKSKSMKLPPLILQPVVENAIKFGLYDTVGQITINIKAWTDDGYLFVQVKNPFDPATSQPKQGTGFGLNSIDRRLYLIYSQSGLLTTTTDGETFVTMLKIPQV